MPKIGGHIDERFDSTLNANCTRVFVNHNREEGTPQLESELIY